MMTALTTALEKTRKHSRLLMGGTGALILATTFLTSHPVTPPYSYPSDSTYPVATQTPPPPAPTISNQHTPTTQTPSDLLTRLPLQPLHSISTPQATPSTLPPSSFVIIPPNPEFELLSPTQQLHNILRSSLGVLLLFTLLLVGTILSVLRLTLHPTLLFALLLGIVPRFLT